jgi:hypothetical protein
MRIPAALIDFLIAALGLACVVCVLFGFVTFMNAHLAVRRVAGEPHHAVTFEVIRPYYQRSAGMHGPDVSVYARGTVDGREEWMDLTPYLTRQPRSQSELNDSVPPGTSIRVYLFPGLKGQSRIQLIGPLPPGEAGRRLQSWVLWRASMALAIMGALILFLTRIRRVVANVTQG